MKIRLVAPAIEKYLLKPAERPEGGEGVPFFTAQSPGCDGVQAAEAHAI